MKHVFTEYVRGLEAAGEPPAVEAFEALWAALGGALRGELSRRGLAHSSPAFLGIYGHETWSAPAFEELLAECYTFVFLDRLRALKAQLHVKPNVEGLVILSIRHFLHERQERHDPLGFQVFRVLHTAVTRAVEQGEMRVLRGDPRVRNDTTLAFVAPDRGDPRRPVELSEVARRWSEAWAPLVVHRPHSDAPSRASEALRELPRWGVEQFRFRDLLDPLKTAARLRWASLLEHSQGHRGSSGSKEPSTLVPLVAPDKAREDDESFQALTSEVEAAIEALDVDERRREHLRRLWRFVVAHATDPGTDGDDVPSFRKTGTELQIPRETLTSLYAMLARLVRERTPHRSGGAGRYPSREVS